MEGLIWKKPPIKLWISRSELHIWRIELASTQLTSKDLSTLLSSEEKKCSEGFIFERDRHRYQVTHYMKRLILANYLRCDPQCLQFEIGKQGKPTLAHLQNPFNMQFNLSHSHHLILMAVTVADAVGIDVEYHAKPIAIESLGDIIFSSREKQFFLSLKSPQEKTEAFFRCWTRKEAYLKARGIGLTMDLAGITVDMNESPAQNWLNISVFGKEESLLWKIFPLEIDHFYTAVAVASFFQKHLFHYDANSLSLKRASSSPGESVNKIV